MIIIKRKYIKIIITIILIIIISLLTSLIYNYIRIKNAKIEVKLIDNLNIEVYSSRLKSDLIESMNGTNILNDGQLDTSKLGKKTIKIKYINDDNIKVSYNFDINIVDTTPPVISKINTKKVPVGYDKNISKEIFCGDNYDDEPVCIIDGIVNTNEVGEYPVIFRATDKAGNTSENNITIIVEEKQTTKNTNNTNENNLAGINIKEIIDNYKEKNNKVGIDVSKWQGDIDYSKVKKSGVEFAIIRMSSGLADGNGYALDNNFKKNIEGFSKVGIPVGVYFFSYADSNREAKKEAKWIIKELKDYKINLPIVFDWENWNNYQEYKLSFKHLTDMANTFMKEIQKAGYTPMLYSSKNYLEDIWHGSSYPIWLAHYTENTDYNKKYEIWQITDKGIVDGINTNVDINIMYN